MEETISEESKIKKFLSSIHIFLLFFKVLKIIELSFCSITITDLYSLNTKEYIKYLNSLPFEEQQKIINKFIEWSLNDKRQLFFGNKIIQQKNFAYLCIVISPDCQKIAFLDCSFLITVIDFNTKKVLTKITAFDFDVFRLCICFSFDSKKLAFKSYGNIIVVNLDPLKKDNTYSGIEHSTLLFSKCDYHLASVFGEFITIYNDQKVYKMVVEKSISKNCYDFSRSKPNLFSFASGHNIIVWDFLQNVIVGKFTENEVSSFCKLSFSDSGSKIVVLAENTSLLIFSLDYNDNNIINLTKTHTLVGHNKIADFLCFSSDEQHIFSFEVSNFISNIFIWFLDNIDECKSETLVYEQIISHAIGFNNKFVTITLNNLIKLFDPKNLKSSSKKEINIAFGRINNVSVYSFQGDFLAKIIGSERISLFNTNSGVGIMEFRFKSNDDHNVIEKIKFSNDDKKIIADTNKGIFIFNVNGPEYPIHGPIPLNSAVLTEFAMLKNGELITGHEEGEINIFSNNQFVQKMLDQKHKAKITIFAFDMKEEFIASGDKNGLIVLWNKNWDVLNEIKEDFEVSNIFFSRKKQNIYIFYQDQANENMIFHIKDFVKNKFIQTINFEHQSELRLEANIDENILICYEKNQ